MKNQLKQLAVLATAAVALYAGPASANNFKIPDQAEMQARSSQNAMTIYALGQNAMAEMEYGNAVKYFKKSVSLAKTPNTRRLYTLSLFTTYKYAGSHSLQTGDPVSAIRYLKAAANMDSSDVFVLQQLGDAYCHQKVRNLPVCERFFTLAINAAEDSQKSRAYFFRAQMLAKQGRNQDANLDFARAVDLAREQGDTKSLQVFRAAARHQGFTL